MEDHEIGPLPHTIECKMLIPGGAIKHLENWEKTKEKFQHKKETLKKLDDFLIKGGGKKLHKFKWIKHHNF